MVPGVRRQTMVKWQWRSYWEAAGTCLASSATINNGFYENAQVSVFLLRAVTLDADPQARWSGVIQRYLKSQEFLT